MEQMHRFDGHSEPEGALRSLRASPDTSRRTSWPAVDPSSAHLPTAVKDLPRLHASSSSALLRESASSDAGLQTLTAFRAALQLRESQLLQPQHIGRDGVLEITADGPAQSPQLQSHADLTARPRPIASMFAAPIPPQQPETLLSEAPLRMIDGMSSELTRLASRASEHDDPTLRMGLGTANSISGLSVVQQVILTTHCAVKSTPTSTNPSTLRQTICMSSVAACHSVPCQTESTSHANTERLNWRHSIRSLRDNTSQQVHMPSSGRSCAHRCLVNATVHACPLPSARH